MNWIDENLAVGDLVDAFNLELQRKEGIIFCMDVRCCFDVKHRDNISHEEVPNLHRCFQFVNGLLDLVETNKVLIHCMGGMDRSPFIAMLYYSIKHNVPFAVAYRVIREKRPQTIEHWEWVETFRD